MKIEPGFSLPAAVEPRFSRTDLPPSSPIFQLVNRNESDVFIGTTTRAEKRYILRDEKPAD